MQIIGIMLVKDEAIYIEQAARNVVDFCDRLIILDNMSSDGTWEKICRLTARYPEKIISEQVSDSKCTHRFIEEYASQDVFVFGIDGDEIYDPAGLARLKSRIQSGEFNDNWCVYGHVLHVTSIDLKSGMARGFSTPAARSMTKLYNFRILESWNEPRQQRLHGHNMKFKPGYSTANSLRSLQEENWEDCEFKCMHMCFVARTPHQGQADLPMGGRKNISELHTTRDLGDGWKANKYAIGEQVTRATAPFFRGAGISGKGSKNVPSILSREGTRLVDDNPAVLPSHIPTEPAALTDFAPSSAGIRSDELVVIPDRPHMGPDAVSFLEDRLRSSKCFLEYGAGGSTHLARFLGVPKIYSVESDGDFVAQLRSVIETRPSTSYLSLNHVDLGPTKVWGGPATTVKCAQWPDFAMGIWDTIAKEKAKPDLILIDGRFRVACFIASLIRAQPGTTILFDDYVNRKFYKRTDKYLQPAQILNNSAVFVVPGQIDLKRAAFDLAKYCMDAR